MAMAVVIASSDVVMMLITIDTSGPRGMAGSWDSCPLSDKDEFSYDIWSAISYCGLYLVTQNYQADRETFLKGFSMTLKTTYPFLTTRTLTWTCPWAKWAGLALPRLCPRDAGLRTTDELSK
jgi:hypothetical protein